MPKQWYRQMSLARVLNFLKIWNTCRPRAVQKPGTDTLILLSTGMNSVQHGQSFCSRPLLKRQSGVGLQASIQVLSSILIPMLGMHAYFAAQTTNLRLRLPCGRDGQPNRLKPFGCRTAIAGLWCRAHVKDIDPGSLCSHTQRLHCLTHYGLRFVEVSRWTHAFTALFPH